MNTPQPTGQQFNLDRVRGFFAGLVPEDWFVAAPEVAVDDGHLVVTGIISSPVSAAGGAGEFQAGAEAGRIRRFRESTRRERIWIARQVEAAFELPVTWAVTCGATTQRFTRGGSGGSGAAGSRESGQVF